VVAYQEGEAKYFGVEAADFMGDDDYNMAYWFKVGPSTSHLYLFYHHLSTVTPTPRFDEGIRPSTTLR
jgi:hypothetical protein